MSLTSYWGITWLEDSSIGGKSDDFILLHSSYRRLGLYLLPSTCLSSRQPPLASVTKLSSKVVWLLKTSAASLAGESWTKRWSHIVLTIEIEIWVGLRYDYLEQLEDEEPFPLFLHRYFSISTSSLWSWYSLWVHSVWSQISFIRYLFLLKYNWRKPSWRFYIAG